MELKFFKFCFRQLLVIVNTYFAENDRIKKKRMRTLFQAEALEFYCTGLPCTEKKIS